ncbi:MAG: YCF48-related protein [Candidatus Latescibacterota bacterium]|jgi:photosystem II stability/assembly factor-like uncharacterized protein
MKTTTTIAWMALALALVLTGCSGDDGNPVAADDNNNPPPNAFPLQWTPTQRTPSSDRLLSVDGAGDTRIAVGIGGTILVRHGNADWKLLERQFDDAFKVVEMVDEKTAIVAGSRALYRSTDAGVTWKRVAETTEFVSDISVFGKFAIAVGSSTILLSDDAGETWSAPGGTFPNLSYRSVAHHTDQIATATANGNHLVQTTDGGKNWAEIGVAELPATPSDIAFFSAKLGTAALSNPTRVFWTDDGGETWSEIASFGEGFIANLDVLDESTAYAILGTGQIHKTKNAGKSWAFETAVPPEIGAINCLDASDPSEWVAVGEVGFLSESSNGGASWQRVSQGRVGTFRSIAFANEDFGVAAFNPESNNVDTALLTTDGGATWIPVDPQIKRPERALFSASGVGLLIGGDEVSKSTNNGASWTDVSPPTESSLLGGAIIDANTYVVCGSRSTVLRSTDGASNWEDVSFQTSFDEFKDVSFFPETTAGMIVGEDGSFRTEDLGTTWAAVNLRAVSIACLSADVAVAVGQDVLRSTDRGRTWNIVASPASGLLAVAFANAKHGVAAGINGLVLETLDGGLTWDSRRESSRPLYTAVFRDEQSALLGGGDGVLLLGTP